MCFAHSHMYISALYYLRLSLQNTILGGGLNGVTLVKLLDSNCPRFRTLFPSFIRPKENPHGP